jgi:hypothetical protein
MKLYGRNWTRRELEARLGRIEQVAGLRRSTLSEGPEAGVEQIQVRTGAGLAYTVLPSRGLDIGQAEQNGIPLCWLSPNGEAHPAYYDDHDLGWLRTATGGLLMTCGLTQAGSPGDDNGESLGLHGRAHHTPARQVCAEGLWLGDEYRMTVRGTVDETCIFGAHLRLQRTLTSWLGQNTIEIQDTVENIGFEPAPHMLLYHFNFGFPLLDETTQISFPSRRVLAREPGLPLDGLSGWQFPQPNFNERVYYHEDLALYEGWAAVTIQNPSLSISARLAWETKNLPELVQWQMPGQGTHVLGIEPANCRVAGRTAERTRGTLVMLQPGQALEYRLKFSIGDE